MFYILAPFIGWFVSGVIKFIINYIRFGKDARRRIGNGGFPSTHTTIMSTTATIIGWGEGFTSPLFCLALAVTFIVIIDAVGIRRHVGYHAEALNLMDKSLNLRESMGHTRTEVAGGIILGVTLGSILNI